jgi:hypothetical protein
MTNHQIFPTKGNRSMRFNQLYQQQNDFVDLELVTKNMQGLEIHLDLSAIQIHPSLQRDMGSQKILYFGVQGIQEEWSRQRCS